MCTCAMAQTVNSLIDGLVESATEQQEPTEILSHNKDTVTLRPFKVILAPVKGKSNFRKSLYIQQTLDVSPAASRSKTPKNDDSFSNDEIDPNETASTAWGVNFGYSLIFVPGKLHGDMLQLNQMGFAFSTGFIAAVEGSDRYGVVCDFLLKAGLEAGNSHKLGIGIDALGGYGKAVGDFYLWKDGMLSGGKPDKIIPYTEWTWKYGLQVWMRPGLSGNVIPNVDALIYARLIWAVDPGNIQPASAIHLNRWKGENWNIGVTFRYKF